MTLRYLLAAGTAISLLVLAAGATADPTLQFGDAPAWVKPMAVPSPLPAADDAPVQVLNEDEQVAFDADGYTVYSAVAFRINTPQGLQAAMTVLGWNPDNSVATVHKVHILRGDKVIDVLADGQTFQTMRRESNLEQSMLDGTLTAVLQPEDVQVGDILDYSLSIRHDDPLFKGHADTVMANMFPVPVTQMRMRAIWPKTLPMRWRATEDLTGAKLTKTADGSELTLAASDYTTPTGQDGAPARFSQFGQVEVTQFASWGDVATLVAPLYDKASTLAPDSKLHAEADKIRALSTDPKVQAAAALHLVQDKVRYLFLGMNEGGYVPADADTTWSRRFGDCKGKTALLLALLKDLGIKAEPALVSTVYGDGLDQRLPLMDVFDHVMVRAEIDGKVYWMDGTRYGDSDLDSLAVPDFVWALPVQAGGSVLEALKPTPLAKPATETVIRIDATAGIDTPAPAHLEQLWRGDAAVQLNAKLAGTAAADLDKQLRDYWKGQYDFITPDKVSWAFDKTAATLTFILDGKATLDFKTSSSSSARQYLTDGYSLGWTLKPDRDATKPHADAPMATAFPSYDRTQETILLPNGGAGFTVKGDPVDQTLYGYEFKRSVAIKDGAFVMEASTRSVVPEVPYKDAMAAIDPLKTLSEEAVYVRAPADYVATSADAAAGHDTGDAKTATDFADRANTLLQHNNYADAASAYEAALKLDPKNAGAMAGRGLVKVYTGDMAGAAADFDAAEILNPREGLVFDGRADMARHKGDVNGALAAFTRALTLNPDDLWALEGRAGAYLSLGDIDHALKDIQTDLASRPDSIMGLRIEASIYMMKGNFTGAVADMRKAVTTDPADDSLHVGLGRAIAMCGDKDSGKTCDQQRQDAIAEFDKAIAIRPSVEAYCARSEARAPDDQATRLADLDLAFKLDPKSTFPYFSRGAMWMRSQAFDKAANDYSAILAMDPKNAGALMSRAQAYDQLGNADGEITDLLAAVALKPDDSWLLNDLCWAYGTHNRDLDKGLDACNAALKNSPSGQYYDSRALIYYQMGKYDLALADYVSALAGNPNFVPTLFAKGVTELRMGNKKDGDADVAKATNLNAHVAETYAKYGMVP